QAVLEALEATEQRERTFRRATTGVTWRVIVTPMRVHGAVEAVGSIGEAGAGASHLILTIEDLTELRRLETVRSDFVAHVSHELRTPLAAMKLLAETLEGALERDPPAAHTFARRISAETSHLSRMVAELLELSRIESGKIKLRTEAVEIAGLIEASIDRMVPLAEERNIRLISAVPDGLPDAWADASRAGEVLINLIHNGIKYTPPGGSVTISAEVIETATAGEPLGAEQQGQPAANPRPMLAVHVTDTGIGIDEDDLPRVFERFFKVDRARTREMDEAALPETRAAAGTGLGLAIARHLAELHGGRVWAESRVGRGSVFSFSLPLASPSAATPAVEPPAPDVSAPAHP
ncbi:MAG TPA: ATP-binding protein, partial [Ktedonobacterales bacterium]|nr:ATP-binding protein [Ktedonobacterales bacterium]